MKKGYYIKQFLLRGMLFGGFGPIVMGIVYLILHLNITDFSVDGVEIFTTILSTYLLAFVHAGVSIFNQIESWSVGKSLLFHLGSLYVAYTTCYSINAWIPFDWRILLIYTVCFVALYMIVWLIVYLCALRTGKRLNKKLSTR